MIIYLLLRLLKLLLFRVDVEILRFRLAEVSINLEVAAIVQK